MTTIYTDGFALLYQAYFSTFMASFASRLVAYLRTLEVKPGAVLDLCCGTGATSRALVDAGFENIIGLDLSPAMLGVARATLADAMAEGKVRLMEADATRFTLGEPAGACLCVDGALNHLESIEQLGRCFSAVREALLPGSPFVFDLLEPARFHQWNQVQVFDDADALFVRRGVFDEANGVALSRVSGVIGSGPVGFRVEQTLRSLVFPQAQVAQLLGDCGFRVDSCAIAAVNAPDRTVYLATKRP